MLDILKTIEGKFDGQGMWGEDNKIYPVPPNYASKSKLVEGDLMKLTITQMGQFIFKQTGPVERKRIRGVVVQKSTNHYQVEVDGKAYNVLNASISYYKARPGDEAVIVIPADGCPSWGAVENVIKNEEDMEMSL